MRHGDSGEPIDILLVEDNPGDVRLTEEAFTDGRTEGFDRSMPRRCVTHRTPLRTTAP